MSRRRSSLPWLRRAGPPGPINHRRRRCSRRPGAHRSVEARAEPSASLRREQAGRPDVEHQRHQEVDQHRRDGGSDRARRRRAHERRRRSARNERPSVSTRPTSSAATNAPRIEPMPPMTITTKARIRSVVAHAGLDRQDRRDHGPGEARQHGAEAEHDREQPLDVDTEHRDHRRIAGAGPHQHADPGLSRPAHRAGRRWRAPRQ